MSRTPVHFLYRFHEHQEFLLFHPLSPDVAHEEARQLFSSRVFGPARCVPRDDTALLFKLLRLQGYSICQACHRGESCPILTWDESWLARTRLTVAPTAAPPEPDPPWKKFFDGLFGHVLRGNVTVDQARAEIAAHEKLLSLSPPYTELEILAAHKRAILQHHTDHGGDAQLAARINVARDVLRRLVT